MNADPFAKNFIQEIARATDAGEVVLDDRGEIPPPVSETIHEIEDFLAKGEVTSPEELAVLLEKLEDAVTSGIGDAEDFAKADELRVYLLSRYT